MAIQTEPSSKNSRSELLRFLFQLAFVGMIILCGTYIVAWIWDPTDQLLKAMREFVLAVVPAAFIVPLVYVISYIIALRELVENLDREQLKSWIVGTIISAISIGRSPGVVVYKGWHDPQIAMVIRGARKSIDVVRGSGCDASDLMHNILEASENVEGQIVLNIYMLDSDGFYGPARFAELKNLPLESARHEFTESSNEYKSKFGLFAAIHPNVTVSIHKFDVLPVLRMTVIDEEHFIFSWFPGGRDAADNVCFGIGRHPAHPENDRAISHLLSQLDYFKSVAQIDCSYNQNNVVFPKQFGRKTPVTTK